MAARIIEDTKLIIGGFIYLRSKKPTRDNPNTYWDCKRLRAKECGARAITTWVGGELVIIKGNCYISIFFAFFFLQKHCNALGPDHSTHDHAPNRDEAEALVIKTSLKRKAEECPDRPPSAIVRAELEGLESNVLSMLPERENLKKTIRRTRRKHLPTNPKSVNELEDIPDRFQKTLTGDQFLLYDSRDNNDLDHGRVIVFATKRNLEMLASSDVWFVDGTFKVNKAIYLLLLLHMLLYYKCSLSLRFHQRSSLKYSQYLV